MISYVFVLRCPYFAKKSLLLRLLISLANLPEIVEKELKNLFFSSMLMPPTLTREFSSDVAINAALAIPEKAFVPYLLHSLISQYILSTLARSVFLYSRIFSSSFLISSRSL